MMLVQSAEGRLKCSLELFDGPLNGIFDNAGVMACREGAVARGTGLDHASDIVVSAFVTVDVAEMDFDPCNAVAEPVEGVPHHVLDRLGQRVVALDVAVGVELDVH
jgi:hypothetical protein